MIRSFLKDDKVVRDANQNGTESPARPSPNGSQWNFDKELEEWLNGKSLCHASSARGCNPRQKEAGGQLALCAQVESAHTERGTGTETERQTETERVQKQHTGKDVGKDIPWYIVSGIMN